MVPPDSLLPLGTSGLKSIPPNSVRLHSFFGPYSAFPADPAGVPRGMLLSISQINLRKFLPFLCMLPKLIKLSASKTFRFLAECGASEVAVNLGMKEWSYPLPTRHLPAINIEYPKNKMNTPKIRALPLFFFFFLSTIIYQPANKKTIFAPAEMSPTLNSIAHQLLRTRCTASNNKFIPGCLIVSRIITVITYMREFS